MRAWTIKAIRLAILFLFLSPSLAADRRPMVSTDLMVLQRVSDPQISPDGRWIVFVITKTDAEKNNRNSDLWIVPAEGGEPRQWTFSPGADDSPRWSPDGKKIAFISRREGGAQIWMMNLDGGEPRRITDISTETGGLCWSPDGQRLAFISDVYPDCQEDACNRKKDQEATDSKVRAQLFDRQPFRIWNRWRGEKRSHLFLVPATGGPAKDLTPGGKDVPPFDLGGPQDYDFSPDGAEICFTRTADEEEALSTNHDLWIVPVTGGNPIRITQNPAADNTPKYSPDGRFIAYRAHRRPGFEADRWRLMIYDRKSQKHATWAESWDRSVSDFVWSSDSKSLYLLADEQARSSVFVGNVEEAGDRLPRKILDKGSQSNLQITRDGNTLLFLQQSLTMPAEICTAKKDGSQIRPITAVNKSFLEGLDLPVPEEIWWKGATDAKVHGWLIKPPKYQTGKKYPFILLIHGGPQGAWEDAFSYRWNPVLFASQGYVVLAANPRGSSSFGQQFTDEISGDWGGKAYQDLMNGVDHLQNLGLIDPDRMGAAGGSYGGYMVNWILGHSDRFHALVSHAGVYNLESMYGVTEELWFAEWEFQGTPWSNPEMYRRWSPHHSAARFKTPTLVIHGEQDFRVPIGEGMQLFTALQRQKVPSKFLYFPDEGHWVLKPQNSLLWHKTVFGWFDTYLKK
jgi:dipeptidyl aminopeptidase/acylaminoacyl peptidase